MLSFFFPSVSEGKSCSHCPVSCCCLKLELPQIHHGLVTGQKASNKHFYMFIKPRLNFCFCFIQPSSHDFTSPSWSQYHMIALSHDHLQHKQHNLRLHSSQQWTHSWINEADQNLRIRAAGLNSFLFSDIRGSLFMKCLTCFGYESSPGLCSSL